MERMNLLETMQFQYKPYLLVLANPTQWFFLGCHGCVYRGHAVHQSKIRQRGTLGKTIVLGLLKRGDKVYTEIVSDCSAARLQSIIRGKASIDSVIHSDGWKGYNGIVDFGYKKHFREYKPYLLVLANPTQWFFLGCHGCVYRGHAVHQSKIRQLQSTPLHGKNEFARDNAHINGIESFWGYAKIRFSKI
jgi:hypothetical protein